MGKLILVIIIYVLLYLSIIAYYKINNFRTPFLSWGMWKDDVKLKGKIYFHSLLIFHNLICSFILLILVRKDTYCVSILKTYKHLSKIQKCRGVRS